MFRHTLAVLFSACVLVVATTQDSDARTWPGMNAWAVDQGSPGFVNGLDPGQQICLKQEFSGDANICSVEVTVVLPLVLDTAGNKSVTFCGNTPEYTSYPCVAVAANNVGTEFGQSASAYLGSQGCVATNTITVPNGGYIYLQCNLAPSSFFANAIIVNP